MKASCSFIKKMNKLKKKYDKRNKFFIQHFISVAQKKDSTLRWKVKMCYGPQSKSIQTIE